MMHNFFFFFFFFLGGGGGGFNRNEIMKQLDKRLHKNKASLQLTKFM